MCKKVIRIVECGWLCGVLWFAVCVAGCGEVTMKTETPSWYVFTAKDQSGPYGYVGRDGKVLTPARYMYASPFDGNAALVSIEAVGFDTWAFIDREGMLMATVEATDPYIHPVLEEGMMVFTDNNDLLGYVDIGNGVIFDEPNLGGAAFRMIEPQFVGGGGFSCGLAAVRRPGDSGVRYIDKSGKNAFPGLYRKATPFSDGFACVCSDDPSTGPTRISRWYYIDANGQRLGTLEFDEPGEFHEGLAAVKIGGMYGYINTRGEWHIAPQFTSAAPFSDGLARIELPDSPDARYIDKSGKVVIRAKFGCDREFSEGLAFVWLGGSEVGAFVGGFIDRAGKVRIRLERCGNAGHFENGLCPVRVDGTVVVIDKKGRVRVRAPEGSELVCYFPGED